MKIILSLLKESKPVCTAGCKERYDVKQEIVIVIVLSFEKYSNNTEGTISI